MNAKIAELFELFSPIMYAIKKVGHKHVYRLVTKTARHISLSRTHTLFFVGNPCQKRFQCNRQMHDAQLKGYKVTDRSKDLVDFSDLLFVL